MFEQLFKCSTLIQEMILMNSVYMDNNATTSLKKEVIDAFNKKFAKKENKIA